MAAPKELAQRIRERAAALERFDAWETTQARRLCASAALEAVGALYDLLPPASRRRHVDPAGVIALHAALRRIQR